MKHRSLPAALAVAAVCVLPTPAEAYPLTLPPLPAMPTLPNPQPLMDQYAHYTQQLSSQVTLPGVAPAAAPATAQTVDQQSLVDATNRYRTAHGLRPVEAMPQLNTVAQNWADTLVREGQPRHRPDIPAVYPAGWRTAKENVIATSPAKNADELVATWAASPGHNANLLDPSVTHIGVGIAVAPNGTQYAVENFAAY